MEILDCENLVAENFVLKNFGEVVVGEDGTIVILCHAAAPVPHEKVLLISGMDSKHNS